MNGGSSHVITGNHLGGSVGGVSLVSPADAFVLGNGVHDVRVGSDDKADRNIINNDDGAFGALVLANRELNFPMLSLASGTAHKGVVSGTLQTTDGTYIVDIYASPNCSNAGYGEGTLWLESAKVEVHPLAGVHMATAAFSIPFTQPAPASMAFGTAITATATDAAGNVSPNNTSEFSKCTLYLSEEIFKDGFDG